MESWNVALVALVTVLVLARPAVGLFNFTILHTNDFHARYEQTNKYSGPCSESQASAGKCFGGSARIVTKVREMRAAYPQSLLLDGGDQFQGTLWFYKFLSNMTARHMTWLNYDAMALGNHEFDVGVGEVVKFLHQVSFPVLSSNIDTSKEPSIAGLFNKSVILSVGDQRVGIVGYTTKDTADISNPGRLIFLDEVTQVQAEVTKLQSQGINKIIALGHAGFTVDVRIAEQVSGVDVVVGGHTNTFLYTGTAPSNEKPHGDYPKVVVRADGSRALCVQDYAYGKYLGVLHLAFDDQGRVVSWGGNPVLLNASVPQNQTVLDELALYNAEIQALKTSRIGKTNVFLLGDTACRVDECNMGNLIADAMVKQNIKHSDSMEWNHVAMAIVNGGGIRSSLERGDITIGDVLVVQPFQNTVDIVEVTGTTLLKVFEHSASLWTDGEDRFGGFLQVSGLRVTYDMSKPVGQRVRELLVTCTNCSFPHLEPVAPAAIYKIIVPNFVANGGDKYKVLKDNKLAHHIIGDLDSDILTEYIKSTSPIVTGAERRIQLADPLPTPAPCTCTSAALDLRPAIWLLGVALTSTVTLTGAAMNL